MKITIDIPVLLYEKAKEALSTKTLKDAFTNPIVMVCLHVITSAQHGVHPTAAGGSDLDENLKSGGG